MQHAGLGRALIGHRADFGHAVMIENLCAGPRLLEPRTCGGDAAARFAGDDDRAHRRLGQVDAFLLGHFGQAQGVRRRAAEDVGIVREDGPQPRCTAQTAAGDAQRAERFAGLERQPKTDEWPERKCKKYPIVAAHAGGAKNVAPVVDHPLPAFRRVEPAQRRAAGAAGLVDARVAPERESQVAAVGRVGGVIGGEFRLGRERAVRAKHIERRNGVVDPRLAKLGFVKGVVRANSPEQLPQLGQLDALEFLATAGGRARHHGVGDALASAGGPGLGACFVTR